MIGLGVLGFGLLFLLATLVLVARLLGLLAQGQNTEGTVVRLVEDQEDHMFAPVIQFTANGGLMEFTHPIYQNPPYKIGEKVRVLYNKNNPGKAKIRTFSSMYLLPLALGLIGFALMAAGFFLFRLN
jgi:hypothetical protein